MEVVKNVAPPRERQTYRPTAAARSEHIPAVTALLGRAFADDPLLHFLEPNPRWRARLTPVLYRSVLRYCLRYGQADITTDVRAVACWLLPSHNRPSWWRELRSGLWALPFSARTSALRRLLTFDQLSRALRQQYGGPSHWYLWTVAVDPDQQGKGHCSALLRQVLTRADRSGERCYLETQNPANVPRYEHFGFRLQTTAALAPGIAIHAMLREPQPESVGVLRTHAAAASR